MRWVRFGAFIAPVPRSSHAPVDPYHIESPAGIITSIGWHAEHGVEALYLMIIETVAEAHSRGEGKGRLEHCNYAIGLVRGSGNANLPAQCRFPLSPSELGVLIVPAGVLAYTACDVRPHIHII